MSSIPLSTLPAPNLGLPPWLAITLASGLLIAFVGLGVLLVPLRRSGDCWLPVQAAAGMAFAAAVFSFQGLERVNYQGIICGALGIVSVLLWKRRLNFDTASTPPSGSLWEPSDGIAMLVASVLVLTITYASSGFAIQNGHIQGLNEDLGYFAQMARALPEAKVATVWTAVLGADTPAAGETTDVWYHWGPIWLVAGLFKNTGQSPLFLLIGVVAPVLNVLLALLSARITSQISGLSVRWSLLIGALAIIAVTFPSMSEAATLGKWLQGEAMPHFHPSVAYQFSYKFEAILVLAAISAWLSNQLALSAAMLFVAAVSAPHTVAGCGLAAGSVGMVGLVLRQKRMITVAAVIVTTLIAAWAAIHYLFGVDMPKSDSTQFIDLRPIELLHNAGRGLRDMGIGLILILPVVPGIWHLLRRERGSPAQLLAWLAVAALCGSYMAFHLLLPDGDRSHFTMYAHAILIVPIGVWGLADSIAQGTMRQRWIGIGMISLVSAFGVYEIQRLKAWQSPLPIAVDSVAKVRAILKGSTWGYFAERDRNWWIPQHAVLAGLLDSRCVRLNEIRERDQESHAARFYGVGRPFDLVPRLPGETDAVWSLRLAQRLGIRFIVEFGKSPLPQEVLPTLREKASFSGLRIFELPTTHLSQ